VITPEIIETLNQGEVFVFGSNAAGNHAGGAARIALDRFGAQWGNGEGLQGDSYAIPTMGTLSEMSAAVDRFKVFALDHPELTFLVTKIGTGIAGWSFADVAPLFNGAPDNVALPIEFEASR